MMNMPRSARCAFHAIQHELVAFGIPHAPSIQIVFHEMLRILPGIELDPIPIIIGVEESALVVAGNGDAAQ